MAQNVQINRLNKGLRKRVLLLRFTVRSRFSAHAIVFPDRKEKSLRSLLPDDGKRSRKR